MASRPVQISIDVELLRRVDRDEEARKEGRSTLIRHAIEHYLEAKRRREIDRHIRRAYAGRGEELESEITDMIQAQAWPED